MPRNAITSEVTHQENKVLVIAYLKSEKTRYLAPFLPTRAV